LSFSSSPDELLELFEDDLNGLDDDFDELSKLAWVVELLEKHPVPKQSAMPMIEMAAIRVLMISLPSDVNALIRGSDSGSFTADTADWPGIG
jgi:ureidoglycolate hydrolase